MKTIFIVNPKAGQGKGIEKLYATIKDAKIRLELDVDVYTTTAVGDATQFVSAYCKENPPARFIACGGDGTANEVLNGIMDFPDCEMGVLPMGTGNDFCRNFPDAGDFKDVLAQIKGETVPCDAIHITSERDTFYCINMVNIGFDCNVAAMTATMKQKPLISGPMAYFVSIFGTLIQKKGADLQVFADGKEIYNGPLLLNSIANGKFCGGGIKSNPGASVQDGKLNVNLVSNVSRTYLLRLLPAYMKGTHMQIRGIEKVISNPTCEQLVVRPNTPSVLISCDGEIKNYKQLTFTAVPKAFRMVVPASKTKLGGKEYEQDCIRENVRVGQ